MILVLERGITEEQVAEVLKELTRRGLEGRVVRTLDRPLVHVHSGRTRAARKLAHMERVVGLVPTSGPRVRREGRRFYPYHFVNWSAVTLLAMGALVCLAGFFPPGVGEAFDPRDPPGAVPEAWYLAAFRRAAAVFPAGSAWMVWPAMFAGWVLLYLLPRLDRGPNRPQGRGLRGRWPGLGLAGAIVAGVLYLVLA